MTLWLPWWLRRQSVCLQYGRPRFDPWVGKILWRRKWQPTPVPLPGKSHGQRRLVCYSPRGYKESDMTERLHFSNMTLLGHALYIKVGCVLMGRGCRCVSHNIKHSLSGPYSLVVLSVLSSSLSWTSLDQRTLRLATDIQGEVSKDGHATLDWGYVVLRTWSTSTSAQPNIQFWANTRYGPVAWRQTRFCGLTQGTMASWMYESLAL